MRLGLPQVSRQLLLGVLRREPAPWTIEIVDRGSGRVVAVESCEDGEGPARGRLHVMRADLERLGIGAFLHRWGRRPR